MIFYAAANQISKTSANVAAADVQIGYVSTPYQSESLLSFSQTQRNNAVRVTVRKSAQLNGEIPFFFARVLGFDSMASEATATAVFVGNGVRGFRPPLAGGNIPIIPFAIDRQLWDDVLDGETGDTLSHDPATAKGNNGKYQIVKWVGVRIMEVNLSGNDGLGKRVIVQPGPVLTEGIVPSGDPTTSDFIYSNVWLNNTVPASVLYDDVSWLPVPKFLGATTMTAQAVMRRETPN